MVVKSCPNSDSQCIFGGFYQLEIKIFEVTINTTIERPQSRTNTMIGAEFMD